MELDTTNHEVLTRTLVRAKPSRRLVPGSTAGPYFSTGHENARDVSSEEAEVMAKESFTADQLMNFQVSL